MRLLDEQGLHKSRECHPKQSLYISNLSNSETVELIISLHYWRALELVD